MIAIPSLKAIFSLTPMAAKYILGSMTWQVFLGGFAIGLILFLAAYLAVVSL